MCKAARTHVHMTRQQLQVVFLIVEFEFFRVVNVVNSGGGGFSGHSCANGDGERVLQSVDNGVQAHGLSPQHGRVTDRQQRRLLLKLSAISAGVVSHL